MDAMFIYRFRAECVGDVGALCMILGARVRKLEFETQLPFPDVDAKMEAEIEIEELREAMRKTEDGHVMAESVAESSTS